MDSSTILSVIVTAYNQEDLLAKALDSILMQKVDFPYEIVVAEDCSTDNTRDVLRKYTELYADIIKPIYNPENLGLIKNFKNALRNAKGKYIAILECDNYWVTNDKLQKQIYFLEKNSDYSAVYTNAWVVDENDEKWNDEAQRNYITGYVDDDKDGDITDFDYKLRFGHTCTLVFRNYFSNMTEQEWLPIENLDVYYDIGLPPFFIMKGKVCTLSEFTSCYKCVTETGNSWSANNRGSSLNVRIIRMLNDLEHFFDSNYSYKLNYSKIKIMFSSMTVYNCMRKPNKDNLKSAKICLNQLSGTEKVKAFFSAIRY